MPSATFPPRPLATGDIVAKYSPDLGEWTAAQVLSLDRPRQTAGVLELNWSGPQPSSVADLGELTPLVLTHHAHGGRLAHSNVEWLLPRGCRRIGTADLLHHRPSNLYAVGWHLGRQLALQRRWDSGDQSALPGVAVLTAAEFHAALADGSATGIWDLRITEIDELDCSELVAALPGLRHLVLSGNLGTLTGAAALNRLSGLTRLTIGDLFGMEAEDCLLTSAAAELEFLALNSVPADYAAAMRSTWQPEISNGTTVEIRSPRQPDWVERNRDNPLRDWEGRAWISDTRYRTAVEQYRLTRREIIALLSSSDDHEQGLTAIGVRFGEAFNHLDGDDTFIETEERDELYDAVGAAVAAAELATGQRFPDAHGQVMDGVDQVRSW